ncbi:MAG: hypothetical protein WBG38_04840 [Nodosilinea sp.]
MPPRLVVAGTVGAGKSTFVHTASAGRAIHTERSATDSVIDLKPTTTVALDFAQVVLDDSRVCQIYGLPGQERFDFIGDLLMPTAQACLVLVAAHRPQSFPQTRLLLQSLRRYNEVNPQLFVGLTHTDHAQAQVSRQDLGSDAAVPLLMVDPRCLTSVRQTLTAIVNSLP